MALSISVLKETAPDETRVAATPETVRKYEALGASVTVQAGAGESAAISDDTFASAGARIVPNALTALKDADIVLCVQKPEADILERMKPGATLIGMLSPYQFRDAARFERTGASAVALELVPRITRAQAMDVLSSQANLAGYRAVIEAASIYGRAMPMMMTAAGTVAPARVFIMGAGVAGLQAIATARRLGAVVSATDVRAAAREQVHSLGATFVMVENEETKQAETAGGYAKEMSEDYKRQQAALIAETIKKQDIVITTALIPGRPAPVLVTPDMVKSMKPGSVIVDMATEAGGNCPLSEKGKVVEKHGVTIIGYGNLPARIAVDASQLYARNVLNVVTLLLGKEKTAPVFNFEDEIIQGFTLIHNGKAVHKLLGGVSETKKAETPKSETPKAPTKAEQKADDKPAFKRKPESKEA
ncbi:MAG: Re/Si-specific NAD(P)(+) transhydrogenase subunit alpha [Rhodospirillales bacterium]|nr:Re/Si-specific NAD(P)(+) transhydrogenase subunit alpha [Rhodospirillales bacterium]USO08219.1 MAG: Re/Si-specific NAD(P)(+) transhydrogenase subunit alpha [Rhodospirillales bacterium]